MQVGDLPHIPQSVTTEGEIRGIEKPDYTVSENSFTAEQLSMGWLFDSETSHRSSTLAPSSS